MKALYQAVRTGFSFASKYKNISEFIFKLKDIENKLEFLQNLKYCDTKNRKIPKNTCQNIIDFLGV